MSDNKNTDREIEMALKMKEIMDLFSELDLEYKNLVLTEIRKNIREDKNSQKLGGGFFNFKGLDKRLGTTYKSLGGFMKQEKK